MANENIEIGMGATVHMYADSHACTVVSVSKSGKKVVLQEDNAVLDNFKPEVIPGGFVGHVVNQNEQKYIYTRDPDGREYVARMNKNGKWKITKNPSMGITFGVRHKFYDYNF